MGDAKEKETERRYTSEESQQGQRKREESKTSRIQAWQTRLTRAEKVKLRCKVIATDVDKKGIKMARRRTVQP